MKIMTVALYHSYDMRSDEFWNTVEVSEQYGVSIATTGKQDWGGEEIFTIMGADDNLDRFAREFCSADSLSELAPALS